MTSYITKAKTRTARNELDRVLRRFEPRVARAFLAAVRGVSDQATLAALSRAIEQGNLDEAIRLAGPDRLAERLQGVGLEPGQPSFKDEIIASFREGGVAGQRQLPREAALAATLDITNPEAVNFLRETVPGLIREISDETREAVRQAALRGFEEGRPARMMAREIRESVGLTQAQSRAVGNFRRQLESGTMGNGKPPWMRRLSATEQAQARSMFRAAASGSLVDRARIDAITERYHQSLLNRRARTIARTETTRAFGEGQQELWRQAEMEGLIDRTKTRRIWLVTPDERLRPDHAAVPGMNLKGVGLDEPFDTPIGPVMGPRQSGNPAFDVACRCTEALEFLE